MNLLLKITTAVVGSFISSFSRKLNFDAGKLVFPACRIMLCLLTAILIYATYSCGGDGTSRPLATVNGMEISIAEFNKRFVRDVNSLLDRSSLAPEDSDRLKEEVLNILIDEKVMLLRAKELSISVSDAELAQKIEDIRESYSLEEGGFDNVLATRKIDYGQWKEELRKRTILEKLIAAEVSSKVQVKEDEGKAYRRGHKGMYAPEKRVHVAQIVVREREKAAAILKRLMRGEDFGKVAREESIGPEAKSGGDLGFVSQGFMPEEIDAAIFSQQPGEIGPVIRSPFGYHIFKIIEKDKKRWDVIKSQVLTDLRKQKEEEEYALWLSALRSKAEIRINRDLLKKEIVLSISEAE
ncbi:MAG: peptidylprolyl isomerase [Syntrophales bacterium]|jgi:parvulin-like peptidyl-prolyl isomerase